MRSSILGRTTTASRKQMSVKDAVGCFLDYHGWQLITKSFAEHLVDEGYCDASDVGIEDTYEDDDRGDE